MSFHKIAPIKRIEKPAPKKHAPKKDTRKKHEWCRPVGHQR
ncbi:hypothetical protein [Streptomyces sp. NPDC087437]